MKKREEWKKYQPYLDIKKIHFLDESSINLGMTRLYGWGFKNERVIDYVPDVRFERMSILSTVNATGEIHPFFYSGTLNGDLFRQYIEFVLAPALNPGDIVVMDNLSVHKVKGISEAIEAVGANVVYLPPYSPDLNPIELAWNEIKADLRKLKARSYESLSDALTYAFYNLTEKHIMNYCLLSGYSDKN